MRQFFNILKFEFSSYLKNKVFVGITIALIVIVSIVLSFPRISALFEKEQDQTPEITGAKPIIYVSDLSGVDPETTLSIFSATMPHIEFKSTNKSIDELKTLVDNEGQSAVVIQSATKYTYIVKNAGMYDNTQYIIDSAMQTKYRVEKMHELGLTIQEASAILNEPIQGEVIKTGIDQMQNFFYTYVLIFALYMAILLYGQFVATSVATEKSSRAMELLITSAKPTNLMFGKVLGSGLAGLLQLTLILGSSFVFFNLNKSYWAGNQIVNSIFNMPLSILLYTILFFILGFFIYAFLFGAVGSLASKLEDINTSVMPITFLFIIAFFIVMFSMGSGNVDSTLMVIASYVPFTSPMAMFVRIAMGNVSALEIIISVAILIASTIGVGFISAKIYRIGVLLYGTPPKLSNVLKNLNK